MITPFQIALLVIVFTSVIFVFVSPIFRKEKTKPVNTSVTFYYFAAFRYVRQSDVDNLINLQSIPATYEGVAVFPWSKQIQSTSEAIEAVQCHLTKCYGPEDQVLNVLSLSKL